MRRREVLGSLAIVAAWPRSAFAEAKRRLALLMPFAEGDTVAAGFIDSLRRSLAELGWREGANLKIEVRWSGTDHELSRTYAKELAASQPDVIVAHGPTFAYAREATRAVPLVFLAIVDPVGQGFVSSLSRPGGNITGFMLMEFSIGGKFIELLREIAPKTKRVAVFVDPSNSTSPQWWRSIEGAARDAGIEPRQEVVRNETDIDAVIGAITRAPDAGFIIPPQALFTAHRTLIIRSAARERLPAVYSNAFFVKDGGLLSYGSDLVDQYARAASYIDRILKGEKPADLPVQAPTKYGLVINLKTAKTLGITVPPALLARADEVIE
jgi:putative tryptophan/tyrosine transport system substrate-binding protein